MFVDVSVEVVLISFDFVSILSGFCSFLKGVSFECICRGSAEVNMSVSLNILKNGDYYNSVDHNSDFFFKSSLTSDILYLSPFMQRNEILHKYNGSHTDVANLTPH